MNKGIMPQLAPERNGGSRFFYIFQALKTVSVIFKLDAIRRRRDPC
jgi:hypothetical protein